MAQTRKRRRKHRGTQAGSINRRKSRPRNRTEAKAQARNRGGSKGRSARRSMGPPTWRGAINRALIAAGLFFALMLLAFQRPLAASLSLAVFMLAFYIPVGYFLDNIMYRRREAKRQREREARKAG